MGYRVLSNVVLNPYLESAIKQLADSLSFDIVITSGVRTAARQAAAMNTKFVQAGGGESGRQELIDTYSDDSFAIGVADFLVNGDLAGATDFIQAYFDAGKGSSHGRGEGFDVRTSGGATGQLNPDQIAKLISTVEQLGWKPYLESIPPHLHITLPRKKKSWWLFLAIGVILWIQKN